MRRHEDAHPDAPELPERRKALSCLAAWTGAAVVWTVVGGVPRAFAMGDPERDYGTTFVNEVGKLRGKLYYDLLDLDGSGSNPEQEQVAKEGAERLRKLVEGRSE